MVRFGIWVLFCTVASLALMACGGVSPAAAPTTGVSLGKSVGPLSTRLSRLAGDLAPLSADEQAAALSLPATGPGSLVRDGRDILVTVRMTTWDEATRNAILALVTREVSTAPQQQSLTAMIPIAQLNALAAVPGVVAVREELAPQ